MIQGKKVFVGVSGGVDSSVAALLLKKQGYDVTGVFIRTWTPEWTVCTWKEERRDAMRVCAALGIPYLECDAEEAYKKGVADYMIAEYEKGRTPNPDVMCNRLIKFGAFWEFAKSHGADFIATGHYTGVHFKDNTFSLLRSPDEGKDQSYFLWTLTEEDLAHILFPLGKMKKDAVRRLAKKHGLPTAEKKDSQGVCFLGAIDMKEFLSHYVKSEEGKVLDTSGQVIGTHPGAIFFTIGERHGFHLATKSTTEKPQYVVAKDMKKNTIVVAPRKEEKEEGKNQSASVILENVVWRGLPFGRDALYVCQTLYHGKKIACSFTGNETSPTHLILYDAPYLASGQSIVVYEGDTCLGGGVVV